MKRIVVVMVVLLLVSFAAQADNIMAELDDVVVRGCETSCLIGTTGTAIGLFWPLCTVPKLGVEVGPMGAIGNEAIIGGVGAQLPVSIVVGGQELPINYICGGGAYDWGSKDIEIVVAIGKTFEVEF